MATAELRVTVDTAPATELIERVRKAASEALAAARLDGQELTPAAAAETAVSAALVEILRVRSCEAQEVDQLATKLARVRVLHHDEYGLCAECTDARGVPWPCPTTIALDEPKGS